jgi:hypothetical protein
MEIKRAAAGFCIVIGALMFGMWSFFLAAGTVPELETRPAEIVLHLAAEFLTAVMLIIGGFGLLRGSRWGFNAYLVASGLLTYTLIMSPGYYLARGEYVFVAMFGAFLLLDLAFLALMLRDRRT